MVEIVFITFNISAWALNYNPFWEFDRHNHAHCHRIPDLVFAQTSLVYEGRRRTNSNNL